ncbi:MAG: hypothetical protein CL565_05885 [Alphaproteobacteria bacterium]|nr:hypothetical protein [Alphaproteobacteria bacterium]|tara:strand:+ start:1375 stop:2490 length:1116 start_codon:yes stop_codon:yes gene_type:complete
MTRPSGTQRGEIFVDRRKVFFFNVGIILLGYVASLILNIFYYKSDYIFTYILTAIFYVVFTIKTWPLFFKTPHLKIFSNGLEIRGLGFREWKDISFRISEEIVFLSTCGFGKADKKIIKNSNPKKYEVDSKRNRLDIYFEFPYFTANISTKKFYNLIISQTLQNKPEAYKKIQKLVDEGDKKTWRTYIFGSEKLTYRNILWNIFILLMVAMIAFPFLNASFFPSASWKSLSNILSIAFSLPLFVFFVYKYRAGKLDLSRASKFKFFQLCLLLTYPAIFYLWFYLIFLSVGKAINLVYGHEVEKVVLVNKQKKADQNEFCLESMELGTGILKNICLQEKDYKNTPKTFNLTVIGKGSWFGLEASKYNIGNYK